MRFAVKLAISVAGVLLLGVSLAGFIRWGIEASPNRTPLAQRAIPTPDRSALTRPGQYRVSWRPADGEVPLNQYFDLEISVERTQPKPLSGVEIRFDARMPEHGHGMNVRPRVVAEGDGRYRVDGVLLHMAGRWVFEIEVAVEEQVERAAFEVTVGADRDGGNRR
jgi:hypothetical protein